MSIDYGRCRFLETKVWLKVRGLIICDILRYKIASSKKSYDYKAIQEFQSSNMELHDKNGVKDRILDDLGKSIKLVRRTVVLCCVALLQI
jgi:hypothetical protein